MPIDSFYSQEDLEKLRQKKSFCIPKAIEQYLGDMTDTEKAFFLNAMFAYAVHGEFFDPRSGKKSYPLRYALEAFYDAINENNHRYIDTCRKNAAAARQRWEKKG